MPEGFGGPLGGPMGGGPMMPRGMPSPETVMRPAPGGADGRAVLSSPLAQRLGGPLMQAQQQQQMGKALSIARTMIQAIAKQMAESDPKRAADLEQMAAKLLKLMPAGPPPPTTAAGVRPMAGALPQPGAGGPAGSPPPPVGGTTALSGLPGMG